MLLVDVNVLVHAINEDADEHATARRWLLGAFGGREVLGLPWLVCLAFLRLTTHPAILDHPLTAQAAADHLEAWLDDPQVVLVEPTRRHLPLLRSLLVSVGTAGNLVSDAHLAALALEHDATVVSFDRDFGRFAGVRWRLPE